MLLQQLLLLVVAASCDHHHHHHPRRRWRWRLLWRLQWLGACSRRRGLGLPAFSQCRRLLWPELRGLAPLPNPKDAPLVYPPPSLSSLSSLLASGFMSTSPLLSITPWRLVEGGTLDKSMEPFRVGETLGVFFRKTLSRLCSSNYVVFCISLS